MSCRDIVAVWNWSGAKVTVMSTFPLAGTTPDQHKQTRQWKTTILTHTHTYIYIYISMYWLQIMIGDYTVRHQQTALDRKPSSSIHHDGVTTRCMFHLASNFSLIINHIPKTWPTNNHCLPQPTNVLFYSNTASTSNTQILFNLEPYSAQHSRNGSLCSSQNSQLAYFQAAYFTFIQNCWLEGGPIGRKL